jgi:hypothetical protein
MFMKSMFAAAAVAAVAVTATAPADAKVKVDLYLGAPIYDYDPGYPVYDEPYPVYERPRYRRSYGISCEQGRRQVREEGFRRVRAVDCSGRRYTYEARRDGERYIVRVSRRSGDIISVQEAY